MQQRVALPLATVEPAVGASESLRAAYDAASRARTRRGAIAYCAVAIVLVLAAIPLDDLRFPELSGLLLRIRGAGILALAAIAAVLWSGWGRRHPRPIALLAPGAAIFMLYALALITRWDKSPFIVSTNFAILGIGLLIPWPVAWSALECGLVVGGYVAVGVAVRGWAVGFAFLDNLMFFATSSGLAVGITALLERRRWREFTDEWALAAAHRVARASAERYRSVVDTAGSVIVVLSADNQITEVNREAERILGWPRDAAVGEDFLSRYVPGPSRAAMSAAVGEAFRGTPVRDFEARMKTRGGAERVLACNVSPLTGDGGRVAGVIVCGQDISDRKRAEEALRESERRLRTVIGDSPVVLFALDANGIITLSEGKGLIRIGVEPGALVGQRISDVLTAFSDDPALYADHFDRALAGDEATWVGSVHDASFECRLTPTREADGRVTGAIGVALDVTEQRQADAERLALERKLLEAQKLESLGVLASGVAHDFNNLLVTVLGNVSLAREELPPGSPARERLRRIEMAARRGSDLTRQMLAYAGRGKVMLEMVDVNAAVEEMKDLLQVSLGRGVAVEYDLAASLPPVEADPTQVRQMVMNLVINASEAIGEREGRITVRTRRVELAAADLQEMQQARDARPGSHLCLEVADSGPGIDAPTLARIFEPFYSTKLEGRGLGLATVLGAVRGHRGALAVASEPGQGTAFRIFLPCPEAATTQPAENDDAARTVLLVEDQDDVRIITAHMLERLGCSVLQAGDGREGVEVFRAHAQVIDAVILDLTLPRLSGEGAFREIRDIRPDARVIMTSGNSDESITRRLTEAGLAAFLRKPFSVADLRSTIGRVLT